MGRQIEKAKSALAEGKMDAGVLENVATVGRAMDAVIRGDMKAAVGAMSGWLTGTDGAKIFNGLSKFDTKEMAVGSVGWLKGFGRKAVSLSTELVTGLGLVEKMGDRLGMQRDVSMARVESLRDAVVILNSVELLKNKPMSQGERIERLSAAVTGVGTLANKENLNVTEARLNRLVERGNASDSAVLEEAQWHGAAQAGAVATLKTVDRSGIEEVRWAEKTLGRGAKATESFSAVASLLMAGDESKRSWSGQVGRFLTETSTLDAGTAAAVKGVVSGNYEESSLARELSAGHSYRTTLGREVIGFSVDVGLVLTGALSAGVRLGANIGTRSLFGRDAWTVMSKMSVGEVWRWEESVKRGFVRAFGWGSSQAWAGGGVKGFARAWAGAAVTDVLTAFRSLDRFLADAAISSAIGVGFTEVSTKLMTGKWVTDGKSILKAAAFGLGWGWLGKLAPPLRLFKSPVGWVGEKLAFGGLKGGASVVEKGVVGFLRTDVRLIAGMMDRAAGGMLKNRYFNILSERAWLAGPTSHGISKGERIILGTLVVGEHAQNLVGMWLTGAGVTTLARGAIEGAMGDRWNVATKEAAAGRVGDAVGFLSGKVFVDPRGFRGRFELSVKKGEPMRLLWSDRREWKALIRAGEMGLVKGEVSVPLTMMDGKSFHLMADPAMRRLVAAEFPKLGQAEKVQAESYVLEKKLGEQELRGTERDLAETTRLRKTAETNLVVAKRELDAVEKGEIDGIPEQIVQAKRTKPTAPVKQNDGRGSDQSAGRHPGSENKLSRVPGDVQGSDRRLPENAQSPRRDVGGIESGDGQNRRTSDGNRNLREVIGGKRAEVGARETEVGARETEVGARETEVGLLTKGLQQLRGLVSSLKQQERRLQNRVESLKDDIGTLEQRAVQSDQRAKGHLGRAAEIEATLNSIETSTPKNSLRVVYEAGNFGDGGPPSLTETITGRLGERIRTVGEMGQGRQKVTVVAGGEGQETVKAGEGIVVNTEVRVTGAWVKTGDHALQKVQLGMAAGVELESPGVLKVTGKTPKEVTAKTAEILDALMNQGMQMGEKPHWTNEARLEELMTVAGEARGRRLMGKTAEAIMKWSVSRVEEGYDVLEKSGLKAARNILFGGGEKETEKPKQIQEMTPKEFQKNLFTKTKRDFLSSAEPVFEGKNRSKSPINNDGASAGLTKEIMVGTDKSQPRAPPTFGKTNLGGLGFDENGNALKSENVIVDYGRPRNRSTGGSLVRDLVPKTPGSLAHRPSWKSERIVAPVAGKTTTLIGNYKSDMHHVLGELNYPKSTNFGPKEGGFNLLNVPNDVTIGVDFWKQFNEPWLRQATNRGDVVVVMSNPSDPFLLSKGGQSTGFGREVEFMNRLVSEGEYTFIEQEGKYVPRK
ncbi:MAG: hypothetical protein IPN19_01950 [Elusimicrobia bacterium]|nr:hypothetical protein [Elusimicrobiota bacterium]